MNWEMAVIGKIYYRARIIFTLRQSLDVDYNTINTENIFFLFKLFTYIDLNVSYELEVKED